MKSFHDAAEGMVSSCDHLELSRSEWYLGGSLEIPPNQLNSVLIHATDNQDMAIMPYRVLATLKRIAN